MLLLAIFLFLFASAFGVAILIAVLQDEPASKLVLLLHGSIAGTAILAMIGYVIIYGAAPLLIASLILFLIAALGGLTLFVLARKRKSVPKLLVIIHPLVALAGLITLVIYALP